jgi:glutaredoxin
VRFNKVKRISVIYLRLDCLNLSLSEWQRRKLKRFFKQFEKLYTKLYFGGRAEMIVYTKDKCPACVTLKARLTSENIPFTEMKIGTDITREEFMKKFPNVRTVPHMEAIHDNI